jgi:hypothetical protein
VIENPDKQITKKDFGNMKKLLSILATVFLIVLVSSCSNGSNEQKPESNEITVSAPPQINTFKINDFVNVVVQNNSEHEMALMPDGISILLKNGDEWIHVENSANVVRNKIILRTKDNIDYSLTDLSIFPEITTRNYSVILRITITGIDQSTSEKVIAYVDVTLFP